MNDVDRKSPRVISSNWGSIEAEHIGRHKDLKLWPGGGREWNWEETNTQHDPGIQATDVQELLHHGSEIVILSTGRNMALQVSPDALRLLEDRGIRYHILETGKAIALYNLLAGESRCVGGLFHTTC